MWVFVIVSLTVVGMILLHIIFPKAYHWPSTWEKINKIPGPPSFPFFGSLFYLAVSNEEFLPTLAKLTDQLGPIWKCSITGTFLVFLTDLDDVEVILNSRTHITKGLNYEYLLNWLGTGLLISTGKKWFDHRRWLTPAFHFTILEQYVNIMSRNAEVLVQILNTYEEGQHVEINRLISYCTLDIICETAMGVQVNAQLGGDNEYVKSVIRMGQIVTRRILSPWLHREFVFKLTPAGREQDKLLKIIHGFSVKVIKERQLAYRKKNSAEKSEISEDAIGAKKKISFLDLIIEISETQNRLTEEEIREEVDTFMFEGHDTTASALSWSLYELGRHPEIQEKAYQEQQDIFQGNNREATLADLQEMKYLERIVKETLRLYPSVPIMTRKPEENVKIRNYEIPAGTEVPIFTYYIHRNPKIYPEPEQFNPDRFLPEVIRQRHPYSYIPFSAGPRNCIGQKFAMMEEKVILSHLIRNFKMTTVTKPEELKIMGELILRPKEDIKMIFSKRTENKI